MGPIEWRGVLNYQILGQKMQSSEVQLQVGRAVRPQALPATGEL